MRQIMTILFLGIVLFSSCDTTPVFEDVNIITNTSEIVNTAIAITFKDGKDGSILGNNGEVIRVTVTGENANDVYDITGVEKESFRVTKGFLTLGIYPGQPPSVNAPLKFNLVVRAPGFFPTSIPLQLYHEGRTSHTVSLVRLDDPPEGVAVIRKYAEATNGALDEDLEIITDMTATTGTKATVTASAGTIIKDANGTLLSGTILAKVAYFNNQDPSSLAAYPGGLVAEVNEDGNEDVVQFYSAGFVGIEMTDEEGRQVKTFENGTLNVEIEVPTNTYNPETGGNVQTGDIIPLWSYDVETGIWEKETELTISTNTSGQLVSTAQLDHLSFWNWDWKSDACGNGIKISICSDVDPIGTPVQFSLDVIRCSDGVYLNGGTFSTEIGGCIQFVNVPANEPVTIRASLCGNLLGEVKVSNMCDAGNNFYITPVEGSTEVTLTVDGYCPNSDVIVRPTFAFWYKNLVQGDCNNWYSAWFIDGVAKIKVNTGDMYRFVIYYNGNWIEHDAVIQVDANIGCQNIPFSSEMCNFFQ